MLSGLRLLMRRMWPHSHEAAVRARRPNIEEPRQMNSDPPEWAGDPPFQDWIDTIRRANESEDGSQE